MQNKKFLDISKPVQWVKDLFKKDDYWISQLNLLKTATKQGDLVKFETLFNGNNPYLKFSDLVQEALMADNTPMFFKIEEKAINLKRAKTSSRNFEKKHKDKEINDLFYNEVFNLALIRDNIEIIKYLVKNSRIDKKQEFDNHSIFQMSKFEALKVLNYTLFDLNVPISDILMEKFLIYSNEEKHRNTIELIKKRDLYFQLGGELYNPEQAIKGKPNKI